jgi:hypothetical protein
MALAGKKSEAVHSRTGSEKAALKASFDTDKHSELETYPPEAAMLYQMQQMQEDIDELRRYIVSAELLVASSGSSLPTASRGLSTGTLWSDRGTVKIA